MKKVLVIGGSGFIGKNLVELLREKGIFTGSYSATQLGNANENYLGNIISDSNFENIVDKYDGIVYLVTSVSPQKSMNNPYDAYTNDVPNLIKTLESAKKSGIKRVIYASSGGTIYGDLGDRKAREIDKTEPKNHYAICKLTCEKILEMYNNLYGMENISLRISNPFGEGQKVASNVGAITIFANRMINEDTINIFGDGNIVRDYIYVREVAEAFYKALTCDFSKLDQNSRIYNIGSGVGLSLNEIISLISHALDIEPIVEHYPKRDFDVIYNVLDIEKAKKELGYSPSDNQVENIVHYVKTLSKERGKKR